MIFTFLTRPSLVFVLLALLTLAPAQAQEEDVLNIAPAKLSEDDLVWLIRAEDYFNAIHSIRAEFFQISSEGAGAEGLFYLRRPGRLRVEYLPPTPLLIVGDGVFLHFHDTDLGQVSDWPIFDTPLGTISDDKVKFNEDLIVTEFQRRSGTLAISLVKREDPLLGSLTLFFSEAPMELKQWKVVDAQGLVTTVALFNLETNVEIDAKLFVFDDPRNKRRQR